MAGLSRNGGFRWSSKHFAHAAFPGALFVALALAGGCKRPEAPPPPPPLPVTVALPLQREVVEWDEYTGRLDPVELVDVRARVSGLIMSAPFREGAIIQQGDLLVELDVRQFQAELDSQLAEEAKAAAQVDLAQIEFNRVQGVPPEARSASEYDTAAASLRQAQAVLAAARAAVMAARLNVEWCRVFAPISGRISRKFVTPGNLITGGSGTGTLLTTITSIDPIYCYLDVDEQSVLKYKRLSREGKRLSARIAPIPCFLQLKDEKGFPHKGVIDFVDNRIDPNTGTIRGRGVFSNPDGWLIPGFFARVRLPGSGRYQAILVPDAAITTNQNQKLLLIVNSQDIVEARPVTLGALFGELRAITSGIGPADRVIINGQMRARPGVKVAPRDSSASVAALFLPGDSAMADLPPATQPSSAPTAPSSAPAGEGHTL